MFLRNLSAALLGCALLAAPASAIAAGRGPSTPEERKQALDYIQHFMADPLNPALKPEIQWLFRWVVEVPDIHVNLCSILDKLPKGDKQDRPTLFTAMFITQVAFALQNPDKQDDLLAQYQAGIEGVLRIYETLLKSNPKDREPYLDDLIQRRDAGTLPQWVKKRAVTEGCLK
ncbi:MAG TPA: hypothetical protein VKF63_11025 [Terracidiphilus sp.]|nr:hypothetical protein [Terracidiphilus sp.]